MKRILVILVLVLSAASYAADRPSEIKFKLSSDGFVTSWLVRGPFNCKTQEMRNVDYLLDQGAEARAYTLEELLPLCAHDVLYKPDKWRIHIASSSELSFNEIFTPNNYVVAYALCFLESGEPQSALMKLGSDDGVKVWLNGKLIHDNPMYRGVQIDEDIIKIDLNKGMNVILVKVNQGEGGWGFCLRLTDEFGKPLSNETIVLPNLLELSEIENRVAKSVNVSAIVGVTSGKGSFTFSLHSDVSLPMVEKTLAVKSSVTDAKGLLITDVVNEKFNVREGVPHKEIVWEPNGLSDGMYILLTKVLDESGRELVSKDTPIFWHSY